MRNANVLILTDEAEFARLLTACWQTERQAPRVTVLSGDVWQGQSGPTYDLVVVGPMREAKLSELLRTLEPTAAVILCAPA